MTEKMQTVATDLASLPSDAAQQAAAKANNAKPCKAKVQKPKAEVQPQQSPAQTQAAVAAPPAPPAQQTPLTLESLEKRVSALETDMGGVKLQLGTQAAQLDVLKQATVDSTQQILDGITKMQKGVLDAVDRRFAEHERYSGLFGWAFKAWDGFMAARAVDAHNDDVIDAGIEGKNPTLNRMAEAEAAEAEAARAKAVAEANAKQDKKKKVQSCEEPAAAQA